MTEILSKEALLLSILAAPAVLFLLFSCLWLLGWTPHERVMANTTRVSYMLMVAASLWLFLGGERRILVSMGDWFQAGEYRFPLVLFADRLSLPLIALTAALVGLVGAFSVRYLHREEGFFRFFVLLHLFAFGALLIFAAGSYDLLTAGWELVGITSVLLIGFFSERRGPVLNAIRVFAMYRISDLGLLLVLFVFHNNAGSAVFSSLYTGEWPNQTTTLPPGIALLAGALILLAAAGKSALIPFSGWLPRAMEGPTPSSAIFYGAISVHAGAYLLLRGAPLLATSVWLSAVVVVVGGFTAVLASMTQRVSADAKTGLAYASMTQVAIVVVETGMGWYTLALFHLCGHAVLRTLQFLRAPSMLHDYHRVHAAAGGHLARSGEAFHLVPDHLKVWLFRYASEFGFYDQLIDRFVTSPVTRASEWLASFEPGQRPRVSETAKPGEPGGRIIAQAAGHTAREAD